MKKSKNILDFFQMQIPTVSCPACGISIRKSQLNIHLDSNCASSVCNITKSINVSEQLNASASLTSKIGFDTIKNTDIAPKLKATKRCPKSSRLSLKQQKKQSNGIISAVSSFKSMKETEVITLDDDSSESIINKSSNIVSMKTTNLIEASVSGEHDTSTNNSSLVEKTATIAVNNTSRILGSEYSKDKITNDFMMLKNVPDTINNEIYDISESLKNNHSNPKIVKKTIILESVSDMNSIRNEDEVHDISKNLESNHSNDKFSNVATTLKSVLNDALIKNKINTEAISNTSKAIFSEDKITNEVTMPESVPYYMHAKYEINIDFENSDVIAVLNDAQESKDTDDTVFSEKQDTNQTYEPYYIANFKHILNTVLQEECNKILFNDEDITFINAFKTLSDSAQKLYVRLFQRKYKWLRLNKINYPNITNDPSIFLDELFKFGLVDSGLDQIELETALELLSLPEARNVVKQFNFNSSGKNKSDITQMLLKHCKEHKSVFFTNGKNGVSNMVLKKVKQILGPCYRISLLPKRLFTRILMLFSLPSMSEDDDDAAGGQQQQLLTLLQVNKGEITFPGYKINRQTAIFADRDELIRYEEAKQLENDIMSAVESKEFDLAKELYINAKEEFEEQLSCPFVERVASLPSFLKKFTSFHIYVRCMTQGVEILQKMRHYKEAVELLRRLLDQKVFCQDYRGCWWDRMALNLEQHLKQREQALDAIKEAFSDKNVRIGYRHSLLTRALRILKTTDEEDEFKEEVLEAVNIIEAPKVVIKGRLCPRNILGRKNVFISSSCDLENEDDVTVLGVEQLAIEHYKNEGFSEGIHGEGSTFHSIYGLLFWDIIYDGDIPDAFISPYQNHPLDLNHDSFFVRREKQIMSHLEKLKSCTIEEIKDIVRSSWEAHFGQSSLVIWDIFADVEHILGLVSCMDNELLCGICERLARDFRFTRSGVPDLVVWNPNTLKVKIVEVKGPGDKLSSKQILWLDYLLKLGAEAEVCHIEAVGSKKLRKE